ncbi:DUF2188 domain-containing protein [Atopobacter phocae]|uniref:DUF2188 domain-containing protein n=1 Tax=Atopobacter phocae TaxID=136492 RepID=UPI00046F1D08|nr:DUF2188 domain-containing protein [Atopobacter phocae]
MGKNQHVTPHPTGNWQVIGAGNKKPTKLFPTQKEAEDFARGIARNQRAELVTHGRNGRIRSKDSYGNDPCPPRDKEH